MKAIGIVRKIDELGRICVPKEVRDVNGWKSGQPLEMYMDEGKLVLTGYRANEEKEQALRVLKNLATSDSPKEWDEDLNQVIAYLERA